MRANARKCAQMPAFAGICGQMLCTGPMNDKTYDNVCVNLNDGNGPGHDRDIKCCGIGTERISYNSIVHSCCNNELVDAQSCDLMKK